MDNFLRTIQIIGLIASLVLTLVMVFTFRKPRLVQPWGKLLSIALSLAMLFFYLLFSGTGLTPAVSTPVFILGLVVGAIRGLGLRFEVENGQVQARGSVLFLLAWGGSWILTQLVAFWASGLLFSIGLILVYLSTGTQVGLDGITLIRRIFVSLRQPEKSTPG